MLLQNTRGKHVIYPALAAGFLRNGDVVRTVGEEKAGKAIGKSGIKMYRRNSKTPRSTKNGDIQPKKIGDMLLPGYNGRDLFLWNEWWTYKYPLYCLFSPVGRDGWCVRFSTHTKPLPREPEFSLSLQAFLIIRFDVGG